MRIVEIISALLLALTALARADEFERANRLYDEGKFTEAKAIYEQMVAEHNWSANLFYNLGNVDFRLGAPGVAALNYERALALAPGHPEAAMNLKLLRDQTGARVQPSDWHERVFPRSLMNLYAVWTAIAFWIAVFSFVAIAGKRRSTRFGLMPVMLFCLALIGGAYAAMGAWHWLPERWSAVVTARQTEARLAPADRAARSEVLPAGSRVRVKSERGEWVYCALPGGGLGWLPASSVEKVRLPNA